MSSQLSILGLSGAVTAAVQLAGFALAYALRTETFYDVLGGVNFLVLGAYSALAGRDSDADASSPSSSSWADDAHKVVTAILFATSRSWLLLFLSWRAHERGGDSRFDDVKDRFGIFLLYWAVQAVWVYLVSLPAVFVNASSSPPSGLTAVDAAAAVGWAAGIVLEVAADVQKALWVRRGRPGHFCRVGVWTYSRHPNYFGEMLQWTCAFALAHSKSESEGGGWSDPLWWACSLSPIFTIHILMNVSGTGLTHAEGKNLKRYYDRCPDEYAEYRASTSILVPMVGYRHVPTFLKRTIFLDLERYEYRPPGGEGGDGPVYKGDRVKQHSLASGLP